MKDGIRQRDRGMKITDFASTHHPPPVEFGIQHRWEDIGQPGDTHVLLLSTAWHFTR